MLFVGQSSVFFSAFWSSDFFGKLIFLSLFSLSILSWFVLLYKIALLKSIQKEGTLIRNLVERQKQNILDVVLQENGYPLRPFQEQYLVLRQKTVDILDKKEHFAKGSNTLSPEDLSVIETQGLSQILQTRKLIERHLFILPSIVSLAPFLGILGTVWGILISMGEMQKGAAIHSNAVILGGISTALATTVLGLVIAIPALIAYNYIKSSMHHILNDLNTFTCNILSQIEIRFRQL